MLRLSASLHNQPIMSLRLGAQIATATEPVINPHNLKIMGWWCNEQGNPNPCILLTEDVRQSTPEGLIVNDDEVLCKPEELVRHKEILQIKFKLVGKIVKTKRSKLGKVNDFSYNDGLFVQKLYVAPPAIKIFTSDDTMLIDRNQIIEVTDHYILVQDAEAEDGAEEMAAIPA